MTNASVLSVLRLTGVYALLGTNGAILLFLLGVSLVMMTGRFVVVQWKGDSVLLSCTMSSGLVDGTAVYGWERIRLLEELESCDIVDLSPFRWGVESDPASERRRQRFFAVRDEGLLRVVFPVVLAIAFFSMSTSIGGAWALHARRMRPKGERPCSACGYDLRATVGACPECGLADSDQPETTDQAISRH